jgi:TPR repeat protein
MERAAASGFATAQSNLGVLCFYGHGGPQDRGQAITLWTAAAEQGDAQAQTLLGSAYYEGAGVAVDRNEAARWYAMAAPQGSVTAQHRLGLWLLRNDADPAPAADRAAEGAEWLRLAAERGHAGAQHDYALCLLQGRGVAVDRAVAQHWFERAANQGLAAARERHAALVAAAPQR